MNYPQIRKELQSGTSIDEVCRKHHITFKQLCDHYHGYGRSQQYRNNLKQKTRHKYIRQTGNRYAIQKNTHKKSKMYGTYDSLEDALKMRDALIEDGWHQTHVDQLCDKLGIERRKGYINEKIRYH